ncbi:FG-GAP repeat protein [Planobispora takensis]|uniref:FG-GAP repeat protein n=1 Tax=Planobispora takensis TaxID=1367882 RepID=A0A8J3T2T0_9ACTN|nr:hypothetical protein Pta02_61300 [Planobispora takensis]
MPPGPPTAGVRLTSQDGDSADPAVGPLPEQSAAGDRFGVAVAVLDVAGDGKGELLVGASGENTGRGMLTVLPGTAPGALPTAWIIHPPNVGAIEPGARLPMRWRPGASGSRPGMGLGSVAAGGLTMGAAEGAGEREFGLVADAVGDGR